MDFAIDIGQTQARVRTVSDTLRHDDVEVPGFAYGADLLATIHRVAVDAAARIGVTTVEAVAVGSTGLYGRVPSLTELGRELRSSLGTCRVVVADDAVSSHLGALGDQDGVVIAAGTGLVGLARGPAGAARVDGVGSMIGDDGSGWWIGRRGLIAAISASDGRPAASRRLLDRLESRFGPVAAFPAALASNTAPVAVVASFAKDVADAARDGDEVAASIWHEAGGHIGAAVLAGASRAGLSGTTRWSLIGRLAQADDLLQAGIGERLRSSPALERVAPAGDPLDGVARLLHVRTAAYAPMAASVETDARVHDRGASDG